MNATAIVDPLLQHLLRGHWTCDEEDFYALLGLEPDAQPRLVAERAAQCRARLDDACRSGLQATDRSLLQPAIERVHRALKVLGHPGRRADYDAARGNFRGVARCVEAGLSKRALADARLRFLAHHPFGTASAAAHRVIAALHLAAGKPSEALAHFESALIHDPLDVALHEGHARCLAEVQAGRAQSVPRPSQPHPR